MDERSRLQRRVILHLDLASEIAIVGGDKDIGAVNELVHLFGEAVGPLEAGIAGQCKLCCQLRLIEELERLVTAVCVEEFGLAVEREAVDVIDTGERSIRADDWCCRSIPVGILAALR
ncbi:MAG: hypothetical protein ACREFO_13860 [Acetobacteraceae bacterium]